MTAGARIIKAVEDAIAGNFSRVTVEGQTWVRLAAPEDRDMLVVSTMAAILRHVTVEDGEVYVGNQAHDALRAAFNTLIKQETT